MAALQARRGWPVSALAYGCGLWVMSTGAIDTLLAAGWAMAMGFEALRLWRIGRRSPFADGLAQRILLPLVVAPGVIHLAILWALFSQLQPPIQVLTVMTVVHLILLLQLSTMTGWDVRASLVGGAPVAVALVLGWLSLDVAYSDVLALLVVCVQGMSVIWVQSGDRQFRGLQEAAARERELQVAVDTALNEAAVAGRAKARFFAAASHDLRQPLHALAVNATTLQLVASRQGNALVAELSQEINRSLTHSDHLLDSLLDISRLDVAVIKPQKGPVHVSVLCRHLEGEFLALARQQGLEMVFRAQDGVAVCTDAEMLSRILRNLLSNAVKFTPPGGHVECECKAIGDEVIFLVRDDGPGIPHYMKDRIFEEFFQLGNRSRDRSRGLGLGLSIVRRLAAMIGAHVQVDSVPGRQTCFSVRLPRIYDVLDAEGGMVDSGPLCDATSLAGQRVLVVDDEPDALTAVAHLLAEFGAECRVASSLAAAQAVIDAGFEPTLLIVDFRLVNETGVDVLVALRSRLGRLPAMLLTGDTNRVDLNECVDSITVVEHKPLDGLRLAAVMARLASHAPA